MTTLEVITVERGDAVHLRLVGELDLGSAKELEAALRRAEDRAPARTVVDLSGLGFIDSTGLSALVGADERLRASGRRLSLVRGPAAVHRVFEITGLDRRFHILEPGAEGQDGPAPDRG
jgi:anti-sigma B factor antagonist